MVKKAFLFLPLKHLWIFTPAPNFPFKKRTVLVFLYSGIAPKASKEWDIKNGWLMQTYFQILSSADVTIKFFLEMRIRPKETCDISTVLGLRFSDKLPWFAGGNVSARNASKFIYDWSLNGGNRNDDKFWYTVQLMIICYFKKGSVKFQIYKRWYQEKAFSSAKFKIQNSQNVFFWAILKVKIDNELQNKPF